MILWSVIKSFSILSSWTLMIFFVFSTYSSTCGHPYKLYVRPIPNQVLDGILSPVTLLSGGKPFRLRLWTLVHLDINCCMVLTLVGTWLLTNASFIKNCLKCLLFQDLCVSNEWIHYYHHHHQHHHYYHYYRNRHHHRHFTCLFVSYLCIICAPCGLRGCKNRPAPFPGRMSYKATKPGLVLFYIFACFHYIVAY